MSPSRFNELLARQVGNEFAASHQYVAVGAWYEGQTFPQLAKFFYEQADEERGHAMRMVNYLVESGVEPGIGQVAAPRGTFEDHVAPIRLALEQEQSVTVSISELFEVARETRDYRSEQFLDWFLQEQTEEESSMSDLLAVAERTASVPMLLEEYLARETPGAHPVD